MINRSVWNRDPFGDLQRMVDQMDRAFDGTLRSVGSGSGGMVPVDIYEKGNSLFVRAAIPGVKPEDIDVTLEENVLTIRGEMKQDWEDDENTRVYHREHRYGQFSRSIRLPENLDFGKVDARFDNGFVTVELPKAEERKPESRRIPIRGGEKQSVENRPVGQTGQENKASVQ